MSEQAKSLSEPAKWGFGLDIPIRREQRVSRGILEHMCQLVMYYTGTNDLDASELGSRLELILRRPDHADTDDGVHALIVGSFLSAAKISLVFGSEREENIWGYPCYPVRDIDTLSKGLLEIRAEELIAFRFLAVDRKSILTQLERLKPSTLKLSELSIVGALTAIPQVIHPVISYSSSLQSLEVIGTRSILAQLAANALRMYVTRHG